MDGYSVRECIAILRFLDDNKDFIEFKTFHLLSDKLKAEINAEDSRVTAAQHQETPGRIE